MRHPALAPLLLALSFALGTPMTTHAQNTTAAVANDATLLNISAQAEARRVPDVAMLSAGVVTQAADGNTAMRENATQMDKVMAAIKAAGIAERDIQTSGINLNPQYRYTDNEAPKIIGYQASNTVSLKVRDITKLGRVLDSLAAQRHLQHLTAGTVEQIVGGVKRAGLAGSGCADDRNDAVFENGGNRHFLLSIE